MTARRGRGPSDEGGGTPPSSLSAIGMRGGSITLIGSALSFVLQLLSLMVLSRLLMPSDFGIVAMVAMFVSLGNLLRDFGLPLAGLQKQILSPQQASNLFWASVSISLLCSLALALATPLLVALFDEPRLHDVVPPLALGVFLGGLSAQIQVQLARSMKFKALVASDLVGQTLGLVAAIAVAIAGGGYWALVVQTLAAAVVTLAWRWVASAWLPGLPKRGHDTLGLLRTGVTYGAAQLLTFVQSNVDSLLIGTQLGASALGYYNRGFQMLTAPAARLLDPLTQVVIPLLNRAKGEERDPDDILYKAQFIVGAFIVWIFVSTAGTAPALVPLVLGAQWMPVVPIFQILAVGGCFWVFNHVSYWAFISKEKPKELLLYNLVSKPLAIVGIVVGSTHGILGVAAGYTAAMAISWPINLIWLAKTADFPSMRFLVNGVRVLCAGAVGAAGAVGSFALGNMLSPLMGILVGLVASTALMFAALAVMPGSRALLRGAIASARMQLIRVGKDSDA